MVKESQNREKFGQIVRPAAISEKSGNERTARYAQQRLVERRRRSQAVKQPAQLSKKMTGPFFYIMLLLVAFKDLLDVFLTLSIVLSFFIFAINGLIILVILLYYFVNDVKLSSRKLAVFVISMTIETIPILGLLPMTSISLIVIRKLENSKGLSKLINKRAGLTV